MALKQHDFVELTYAGRLVEDNRVFDTTDKDVAKKEELPEEAATGPIIIKLGEGQLLKGLEDQLVGKELGAHNVTLEPEHAFGKKVASKLQIIPTKKFLEQKIMPEPGVQISMDGVLGTVRSVSAGRTIVDFNHPLAGKAVTYGVNITRVVADAKE